MVTKGTKKPRKLAKSNRFPLIEKELHKQTKADLISLISEIATEHAVFARELEDRLNIEKPVDLPSPTCRPPSIVLPISMNA